MSIQVTNNTSLEISVAINVWDDDNPKDQTGYFPVSSTTQTWNRIDQRGYVMSTIIEGVTIPYYVLPGNIITFDFNDAGQVIVNDNGSPIPPCVIPL